MTKGRAAARKPRAEIDRNGDHGSDLQTPWARKAGAFCRARQSKSDGFGPSRAAATANRNFRAVFQRAGRDNMTLLMRGRIDCHVSTAGGDGIGVKPQQNPALQLRIEHQVLCNGYKRRGGKLKQFAIGDLVRGAEVEVGAEGAMICVEEERPCSLAKSAKVV
jgi:hypothetical protein